MSICFLGESTAGDFMARVFLKGTPELDPRAGAGKGY